MLSQVPSNAGSPTPPPRRRRSRQACLPCRQRKRKCDMQLPCTMCTTYSYSCRYSKDEGPTAAYVDRPRMASAPAPADLASHPAAASSQFNADTPSRPLTDCEVVQENGRRSLSPAAEPGVLDPFKSRFMGQSSAVAFPRSLGIELKSMNPPPLHSFGWNCGIRREEGPQPHNSLLDIVCEKDILRFSETYFKVLHPLFDVLDQKEYKRKCNLYLSSRGGDINFGAIIGGAVAIGSFFSASQGHARELDVIQYVKEILDDPAYSRLPSIDQVAAWVLRTIYQRATTRPHSAWLASCTALHLAEATGLHQDFETVLLTTSNNDSDSVVSSRSGAEQTRRLFWCTWSLNAIISYEYGRSSVVLSNITCKPITPTIGSFAFHQYQIAHLIPRTLIPRASTLTQKTDLCTAISDLRTIPDDHPFISLTKADLCFCFYRRLRILKQDIPKDVILQIVQYGNIAAVAAHQLAQETFAFWNVLGSVFQYICVLLAIDTSDSLDHVSNAMDNLEKIVQLLRTHLAVEALTTARLLLRDSMAKKRRELALLERADDAGMVDPGNDVNLDWERFFDSTYATFSGHEVGEYAAY